VLCATGRQACRKCNTRQSTKPTTNHHRHRQHQQQQHPTNQPPNQPTNQASTQPTPHTQLHALPHAQARHPLPALWLQRRQPRRREWVGVRAWPLRLSRQTLHACMLVNRLLLTLPAAPPFDLASDLFFTQPLHKTPGSPLCPHKHRSLCSSA